MRRLLTILAFATYLAGCNNEPSNDQEKGKPTAENKIDTTKEESVEVIKPTFTALEENVSAHIKSIFDHYGHVKTALVNGNAAEAKSGADAIVKSIKSFDRSLLPAEQKEPYSKWIAELGNAAGKISASDNIETQRAHFSTLSNYAYGLAKLFGAGRTIYHDHCPMAFDNKGAMWLSENKEISNPYFGEKMMTCGSVEEVIEK
jgi:hypothetical protein